MELIAALGYIFALLMIVVGLSKSIGTMRPSTRQVVAATGFLMLLLMIAFSLDKAVSWSDVVPKLTVGVLGIIILIDRCVRVMIVPRKGGAILLDLGHIGGFEVIINLAVALALGWYVVKNALEAMQNPMWKMADIAYQVFGFSVAVAVLIQAAGKRKLVQHGVFLGTSLLRWKNIESYGWEKESGAAPVLVLNRRAALPFLGATNISIRPDQMKSAENILVQHGVQKRRAAPRLEL
jgi:hypothetical protein